MKPQWLKVKIPSGESYRQIANIVQKHKLNTVCHEALCPNIAECWAKKTATFMILGDTCTRNCRYCNVSSGKPKKLDTDEPKRIAEAVKLLNLNYAVITSVTRDDLPDQGAGIFAATLDKIKNCHVELLIPDFNKNNLEIITDKKPFVLGHNIEVVESLFDEIRPQGNYQNSLEVLRNVKRLSPNQLTKSGLMIGFGEEKADIIKTLKDLKNSHVDIITIGQYLQPSKKHYPVKKYYSPEEFEELKEIAKNMGFKQVFSAPLVRSSYHADICVNLPIT